MKKVILFGFALVCATICYGQSSIYLNGYFDNFNDGEIANSISERWGPDIDRNGNKGVVYTKIEEAGGELVVTATNADKEFLGFNLYLSSPCKIDISEYKKVSVDVTNNGDKTIRVFFRLKLVDRDYPADLNCPIELLDTITATSFDHGSVLIQAGETRQVTVDFSEAIYELFEKPCGVFSGRHDYEIKNWDNIVGLNIIINGGAGADYCMDRDVCDPFSGTVSFDNLAIGTRYSNDTPCIVDAISPAFSTILSSSIYPNPSEGQVSLDISFKEASDVKISLFDLMGREVAVLAEEKDITIHKTFNTTDLAKGIYMVNYSINNVPVNAELLVIK